MNLASQITEIRRRLAEPVAGDEEDNQIKDSEIVDWIWQSEIEILKTAHPNVLSVSTTGVVVDQSLNSGGTGYVDLPTSPLMFRPLFISMRQRSGLPYKPCKIVSYADYLRASNDPIWRTNDNHPLAAINVGRIYTSPARGGSGDVLLTMVQVPQRRYRYFSGSVVTRTSDLVWTDSKAVTRGWPDDYFGTDGLLRCDLKYTSGEPKGKVVKVTDYTGSTGQFTTANSVWPDSNEGVMPGVNIGDTYEVGQVSSLPEIFDAAVYAHVSYQAFANDRDDLAKMYHDEYMSLMSSINAAYGGGLQ